VLFGVNGSRTEERRVLSLADAAHARAEARSNVFDEIFAHHYAPVLALVARVLGDRMSSEDVAQDAFIRLSEQPVLLARPDAEVAAWLRRVALNLAFNRLRSDRRARQRLERVAGLEVADHQEGASGPATLLVRQEEQATVRRVLADLPQRQRECLLLRHAGYSYAEIAAALEVAIGSVGVLLARAEHAFRANYERLGKERR
jgi:RNA polymerase sigma-70 factor, ECF subfamily